MEYKHSEGMSQAIILGDLRGATGTFNNMCVWERDSVALKMWAEGTFAGRKFIETKEGGQCRQETAEENAGFCDP